VAQDRGRESHDPHGGPDKLQVGWRLAIPDLDHDGLDEGQRAITVRHGDTLSSIAERELGATSRWTEILPRKPRPAQRSQ
jgi:nucleoid-associated protein YgaU